MDYKKIFQISIWKTLRFDLHYFGLKGLKLPVLVSRNVRLKTLAGGGYLLNILLLAAFTLDLKAFLFLIIKLKNQYGIIVAL